MMASGEFVQIIAFVLCAFIAVAGALGMTTTMSMFRSGVFLMASFIGVAGLFILLAADLMALLQIMMYIGGMLVMILFMVLFMQDPGGAMMAAMPDMMSPVERFFSRGLQQEEAKGGGDMSGDMMSMDDGKPKNGPHQDHGQNHGPEDEQGGDQKQEGAMQMDDMSMVTPVRKLVAWLAAIIGVGLVALIILRPSWPVSASQPNPQSAHAVGMLLMGKYMVAFEGSGFLILIGIFGAVILARGQRHSDDDTRSVRVAKTDSLPTIESDELTPPHPCEEKPHKDRDQQAHQHGPAMGGDA